LGADLICTTNTMSFGGTGIRIPDVHEVQQMMTVRAGVSDRSRRRVSRIPAA
jgi:hypothetical protein